MVDHEYLRSKGEDTIFLQLLRQYSSIDSSKILASDLVEDEKRLHTTYGELASLDSAKGILNFKRSQRPVLQRILSDHVTIIWYNRS